MAPLVVKDKVIVGWDGGEFGIRASSLGRRQDRQGAVAVQRHT